MKNLAAIVIIFSLLTGCASVPQPQDSLDIKMQRSVAVFDSVNNKMFGEVWKPGETMKGFDLVRYNEILATFTSNRAVELRDILELYESKVLTGYDQTFVFCIFSSKEAFAMCDDARCSGVEKKGRADSLDIVNAWLKDLPLSNCPKY